LRHIVLLLLQEDQLVVSIPEQNGVMHDYTSMQPNDVALRPIRSHCFDFCGRDDERSSFRAAETSRCIYNRNLWMMP
jgi:hypothetical protein